VVAAIMATGIPVLGDLRRDDGISAPSRHLGLVPAAERDEARHSLDVLADQIAGRVDLEEIMRIAQSAADLPDPAWDPGAALAELGVRPSEGDRPVVAVAGGRAFTFRYPKTDELLRAAGCEPVVFDPVHDQQLPAGTAGIYLGGGFPEVHATDLAANEPLRAEIRHAIAVGLPTVAECAGLLYLCQSVDDAAMVGALDAAAQMTPKLTLSYRSVVTVADSLLADAGQRCTGHEFHRTTVVPTTLADSSAWLADGVAVGFSLDPANRGRPSVHASYLHTHWAGYPSMAAHFARAVHRFAS